MERSAFLKLYLTTTSGLLYFYPFLEGKTCWGTKEGKNGAKRSFFTSDKMVKNLWFPIFSLQPSSVTLWLLILFVDCPPNFHSVQRLAWFLSWALCLSFWSNQTYSHVGSLLMTSGHQLAARGGLALDFVDVVGISDPLLQIVWNYSFHFEIYAIVFWFVSFQNAFYHGKTLSACS